MPTSLGPSHDGDPTTASRVPLAGDSPAQPADSQAALGPGDDGANPSTAWRLDEFKERRETARRERLTLRLAQWERLAFLGLLGWIAVCSTLIAITVAGGDHATSRTFDLDSVVYDDGFKLGTIPAETKVDVYPTFIVIRRPAPHLTTIVPLEKVKAIDVKAP